MGYKKTNKEEDKKKKSSRKRNNDHEKSKSTELEVGTRDNNPNWYFLDAGVAEQVSQISFQQLAGIDIHTEECDYPIGNIVNMYLNPSPGVERTTWRNPNQSTSGINLAAFRIFSKLSAYTGRAATYAPSDIAIMILGMGSVISDIEWCRRAFGVAFTMNMRNRAYPRAILSAMGIDPDDFFANFANYRMKFNTLVTMVNQIPIPANIAYFDKCASLFEKIYLDDPSSMAQTIIPTMATDWKLEEQDETGASALYTRSWGLNKEVVAESFNPLPMSSFLAKTEEAINVLLNSSSLHVVYTDLLNLALKTGTQFWKFDYLRDDYVVFPEYDENFLLQFHNSTATDTPMMVKDVSLIDTEGVTPWNNVYQDSNRNMVVYNPCFPTPGFRDDAVPACPPTVILDSLKENPSTVDRIEMTRLTTISSKDSFVIPTGTSGMAGKRTYKSFALPDHYVVAFEIFNTNGTKRMALNSIIEWNAADRVDQYDILSAWAKINKHPLLYGLAEDLKTRSGRLYGDLAYYTEIDHEWLFRLNSFMSLGLFDLR